SRERKIPLLLPLPSASGQVLGPGNSSARKGRTAPVRGQIYGAAFSDGAAFLGSAMADFGRRRAFGRRHGGFWAAAPWRISGSAAAFSDGATALLGGATASMGGAPGHRTAEGCVVRPPLRRTLSSAAKTTIFPRNLAFDVQGAASPSVRRPGNRIT